MKDKILSNYVRVITSRGEHVITHPDVTGNTRKFEYQQVSRTILHLCRMHCNFVGYSTSLSQGILHFCLKYLISYPTPIITYMWIVESRVYYNSILYYNSQEYTIIAYTNNLCERLITEGTDSRYSDQVRCPCDHLDIG